MAKLKVAFVIYDGMTTLDFIGVYDPLTRLKTMEFVPDLRWEICALTHEVSDSTGLRVTPTSVKATLADYDMIIVPGGLGSRNFVNNEDFINWLKSASSCKFKISVCTGSLLLGAAGFLRGRRATTHRSALNELKKFCGKVIDARIVDEGDVITARGVTSSIDLGLYLCEKLAGRDAMEKIRSQIDYVQPFCDVLAKHD